MSAVITGWEVMRRRDMASRRGRTTLPRFIENSSPPVTLPVKRGGRKKVVTGLVERGFHLMKRRRSNSGFLWFTLRGRGVGQWPGRPRARRTCIGWIVRKERQTGRLQESRPNEEPIEPYFMIFMRPTTDDPYYRWWLYGNDRELLCTSDQFPTTDECKRNLERARGAVPNAAVYYARE